MFQQALLDYQSVSIILPYKPELDSRVAHAHHSQSLRISHLLYSL